MRRLSKTTRAALRGAGVAACAAAALALAACGPGGTGGTGGGDGSAEWADASYVPHFDAAAAQSRSNSSEYIFMNDLSWANTAWDTVSEYIGANYADKPYTANAYHLARLHVAHGAGLSGNGLTVAVVDDGFLTTHDAFSGKTISIFGNNNIADSHGTFVASVISANPDTSAMIGVAYNADLHLTRTGFNGGVAPSRLASATLEAAGLGAVAQNNSWGYTYCYQSPCNSSDDFKELELVEVQQYMAANNVNVFQAFTDFLGNSNNAWIDYFSALNTFQNSGVVVFALSNDESLGDADATAAIPVLVPALDEAWISVANGLFDLDSNLNITDAALISAPCGQTAEFCLTASGSMMGASDGSNSSYSFGTGTSYAAPQVSGAVALVAEAFPNLSPEDWTKRLLASAYNDFSEFTRTGVTDFGNGVEKSYSDTWGQGVLDLQAALSPIGSMSLVNGRNVETATRHTLATSWLGDGGAFGDSVRTALADTEIAVFDALNGDFYIEGDRIARDTTAPVGTSAAIPRRDTLATGKLGLGAWGLSENNEIAFEDLGYSFGFTAVGGAQYLQGALGLSSENVTNASVLSLADDTTAVYGRYDMGFADFEHFGFIGTHDTAHDGSLAGVGGSLAFDFDALEVTLSATQMSERGGYLGLTASDAFMDSPQTTISALSLGASAALTPRLTLFGGLEYGFAAGTGSAGYVTDLGNATFSGFQLGVRATELWLDKDRLTLTASQPLRVESGTMSLEMPVGRTPSGDILYDTLAADFAPSGRQLDLGLSYAFEPNSQGLVELGFVYSFDAGHIAGQEAAAIGATFTQAF